MNIFGIGLPEMAVIAAIGLLVFGPKRLPELGRTLGRTLRGFQSASQEFEKEFRSAMASTESAASVEGQSPTAALPADPLGEPAPVSSPLESSALQSPPQAASTGAGSPASPS
ncbi:MAG: TatA/E family twin arginine-targeting protein translocase [Synechococcaceae cyanobacterium]|nr:TatA/E family twin arginine-targeting protein translocase [Synechococcaceae cyanobacterium]